MDQKKLTTFDGVVTTKGWVDGLWSDEETLDYLNRLNILGFYEYLVTKALVVPAGKQAYYKPSGKTYTPGKLIQGVRERSWEEFEAALATTPRGEDWELSETGVPVDEMSQQAVTTEEGTTDWDKWTFLVNKLAMEYNEEGMEEVFHNLLNRANMIDDEELRAEQVSNIYSLVENAYEQRTKNERDELSSELSAAGISYDMQQTLGDMIENLSADIEIRRNTRTENMMVTIGRGDLHLGALSAFMTMTNNEVGLDKLNQLISDASEDASARVEMTSQEFFGVEEVDADTYRMLLDTLKKDMSHEERLTAILDLSNHLEDIRSDITARQTAEELTAINEQIDRISTNVQSLHSQLQEAHGIDKSILDSVSRLDDLQSLARMQRSLSSGNFMVQTVLDYAEELLGETMNAQVLSFLDSHFDFSLGENGENLTDFLKKNDRNALSAALEVSPALAKSPSEYRRAASRADAKPPTTEEALANIPVMLKSLFETVTRDRQLQARQAEAQANVVKFSKNTLNRMVPKELKTFFAATKFGNKSGVSVFTLAGISDSDRDTFIDRYATRLANHLVKAAQNPDDFTKLRQSAGRTVIFGEVLKDLRLPETVTLRDKSGESHEVSLAKLMSDTVTDKEYKVESLIRDSKVWNDITNTLNVANTKATNQATTDRTVSKDGINQKWEQANLDDAIEGVIAVVSHHIHQSWPMGNGGNIDQDVHQRSARAILFFAGSGARIDPKNGSFMSTSTDRYMHARILTLARFLPPETSDGYGWSDSSRAWMDDLIRKRMATENTQQYEPSQYDYLSLFSSYRGQRKPVELLMNNVLAGVENLDYLSEQEIEELRQQVDFNPNKPRDVSSLHRAVLDFMGTVGTEEHDAVQKLSGETPDYSGISLSGLHRKLAGDPSRKEIILKEAEARLAKAKAHPAVIKYAKNVLNDDMFRETGANTGAVFEPAATIPILHDAIRSWGIAQRKKMKDGVPVTESSVVRTPRLDGRDPLDLIDMSKEEFEKLEFDETTVESPVIEDTPVRHIKPKAGSQPGLDNLEGVKFEDMWGNIHFIGSMKTANSGAIDTSHIMISQDGTVTVRGFEVKMEESVHSYLPHIGNASYHAKLIADIKKNSHRHPLFKGLDGKQRGMTKLVYDDNAIINVSQFSSLSSANEPAVYAGTYTTDATSRGPKYVTAGQIANSGELTIPTFGVYSKPHKGVSV